MTNLKTGIESILFAAGRPVKLSELAKAFQEDKSEIKAALEQIKQAMLLTGINLVEKDEKYQLATNPGNAKVVGDFLNAEIREKLTEAAVETLAIIVYKQPVSRAEIEAIRGVNSQYILRQLLIRGLVEKAASAEDARRYAYRTTLDFMHHLGLRDIKELPDFEELTKSVNLEEPLPPTGQEQNQTAKPAELAPENHSESSPSEEEKNPPQNPDFSV